MISKNEAASQDAYPAPLKTHGSHDVGITPSRQHTPRPSHHLELTYLDTNGHHSVSFSGLAPSSYSTLGPLTHDSWSSESRPLSPWDPPTPWLCRHKHVHIGRAARDDLCPLCHVCLSPDLPDRLSLLERLARSHKYIPRTKRRAVAEKITLPEPVETPSASMSAPVDGPDGAPAEAAERWSRAAVAKKAADGPGSYDRHTV